MFGIGILFALGVAQATQSKIIGIQSYYSRGWWGVVPPKILKQPLQSHRWNELAVHAPACQAFSARSCEERDKYDEVDVFVSLDKELHSETRGLRKYHPRDKGEVILVNGMGELMPAMRKLTSECKVIRYIFFNSHGTPNHLDLNGGGGIRAVDFLRLFVSPCQFAPKARVQFAACLTACGPAAKEIGDGIAQLYGDPAFGFSDLKFLFNTEIGLGSEMWFQIGKHPFFAPKETNTNNKAVEFTVDRDPVTRFDGAVPACLSGKKLKWFEKFDEFFERF